MPLPLTTPLVCDLAGTCCPLETYVIFLLSPLRTVCSRAIYGLQCFYVNSMFAELAELLFLSGLSFLTFQKKLNCAVLLGVNIFP